MKKTRKGLNAVDLRLQGKHICGQKGRLNERIQCHLNARDCESSYHWKSDSHYWHCAEHRSTNGLCWYCGEFWGGCEASDSEPTRCCPNCRHEFKSDPGEIADPTKGSNCRNPRIMNINHLSHLFPSFFLGGGLAAPARF